MASNPPVFTPTDPEASPIQQIVQIIMKLSEEGHIPADAANHLAQLFSKLSAAPSITHTEINNTTDDPRFKELLLARMFIQDSLDEIVFMLHNKAILKPGEQWTITLGTPCGFLGRVVLQTDQLGSPDCFEPDDDAPRPDEIRH